jgi:hypothetical protein
MRRLALAFALLPLPAAADCTPGETVFSCQVGKKSLQICNETDLLIYSFGPPGAPELVIAEPLKTITFQPWPGAGSSIWESLIFVNEGYTYEVVTSVDRDGDADQPVQGSVFVTKGDAQVAEVQCDPGTASNALDVVWDLKEGVGLCWDFANQSWQQTCNN